VRLFRNGTLIRLWKGDVLNGKNSAVLNATISLGANENTITAYAFNKDNVKSEDATLTVKSDSTVSQEGTLYILAIGVNEYDNPNYRLRYAVSDAEDFGREFKSQQSKLKHYAETIVVPLTDKDATRTNILRALSRLGGTDKEPLPADSPLVTLKQARPEDGIIIFFSGHGKAIIDPDDSKSEFYFIPRDMGYMGPRVSLRGEALEILKRHSVSGSELQDALTLIDGKQFVMVIDACNSGQALEMTDPRQGPMNSKGFAQVAYEKGMYVLTAAQGYQSAIESSKYGHGYLTYALIKEGLKPGVADDENDDGVVSVREWFDYAVRRVPQMQSEKEEECKSDLECLGNNKEEYMRQLRIQQDRQLPRIFYRRNDEAQPFGVISARAGR
jgi:uncharacterized caspase-like protein